MWGPSNTIIDGHTGYLVTSGNEATLAEKIDIFLKNGLLRSRLGK
ncbi:MAG: glycosyltransferase [Deltaproteobacteria bacterium]|nr:MAG: glycosyltransferase [Deltaproteobacteria bacterium]